MPFDFKKEYKEYYLPKRKPQIVEIPKMNYLSVTGTGNPNEEGGEYQEALKVLYPIAYAIKMSYKTDYKINGFFEYVVPPLEGFWWQEDIKGVDLTNKDTFSWISVLRLPDFITIENFEWAKERVAKKKKLDCSKVEFLTIEEGLCVQIMHIGPFDTEIESVNKMHSFIKQEGYELDFSDQRRHHEIYISDIRKVDLSKWKTVIRHPIKKL
ncbi:MAG: GyrI-like domain-containing protein [Sphaerochaetaceae bacterium]|nr:GyrI-like domain-containing protein [Sphaerochaetaceae bacterium]